MSTESFDRAQQFVISGDYASAKSEYENLIDSESDNSAAWYGLGVVNHTLGDIEAAIVAFERAFLINRFHAPTAANLAFLFSQRDSSSAAKYAAAAVDLGLDNEQLQALVSPEVVSTNVTEEEEELGYEDWSKKELRDEIKERGLKCKNMKSKKYGLVAPLMLIRLT